VACLELWASSATGPAEKRMTDRDPNFDPPNDSRKVRDERVTVALDAFCHELASRDVTPEEWLQSHPELAGELSLLSLLRRIHATDRLIEEDSYGGADTQAFESEWHPIAASRLSPGDRVGKYRIKALLGTGGMGEVYLAENEALGCDRALKILPGHLIDAPEARERFNDEVRTLAKLQHPNVVSAVDAEDYEGRLILVMEFCEGQDLGEHVHRHGPLPTEEACDFIRQAAEGLAHIHAKGVVHRDIKPSNLMMTEDKRIRILDLGLARLKDIDNGRTSSNAMLGTFDYVSPEQVDDSRQATERSDLYSLGCAFYFLLSARAPFADVQGLVQKAVAHQHRSPPPLSDFRDDLPPSVTELVDQLLAKSPMDRPASARAVAKRLGKICGSNAAKIAAVGIDLGTTYSVAAYLDDGGRPQTVRNEEGDITTPSTVLFDGDDVIVGKEALRAISSEADQVASCAKREMGLRSIAKMIDGRLYRPEVVQAYVLRKVFRDARRQIGDFAHAVISVPAYFDEVRRKATFDAAYMAGIEVLDIINEPTAAALAYGVQEGRISPDGLSSGRENLLVYDLGGGTFDVVVMSIENATFTTLAVNGDARLGGQDWDMVLVAHVAEHFIRMHGFDPRQDSVLAGRLWHDCEEAKRTLSSRTKARLACDLRGKSVQLEVSREQFETLTAALLLRTEVTTREVLREAGMDWARIDRVLLAGGSSRMPIVREMLKRLTGKEPEASLSLDEVVAHGAALHAGMLVAKRNKLATILRVNDVNSHSLGVVAKHASTGRPENVILIPRNTSLPARKQRTFVTAQRGQPDILLRVVEGESTIPEACTAVGILRIELPADLRARSAVEVTFSYAANGRLSVTVHVPSINRTETKELIRESDLTDVELKEWRQYICKE